MRLLVIHCVHGEEGRGWQVKSPPSNPSVYIMTAPLPRATWLMDDRHVTLLSLAGLPTMESLLCSPFRHARLHFESPSQRVILMDPKTLGALSGTFPAPKNNLQTRTCICAYYRIARFQFLIRALGWESMQPVLTDDSLCP